MDQPLKPKLSQCQDTSVLIQCYFSYRDGQSRKYACCTFHQVSLPGLDAIIYATRWCKYILDDILNSTILEVYYIHQNIHWQQDENTWLLMFSNPPLERFYKRVFDWLLIKRNIN